ncbi:MAG: hypothetical protein Q7W30_03870 [Coriobacteriia bacterium]|nr:hypothetical protein [Coriobacteriia bacterium]
MNFNRLELRTTGEPIVLITWHLPREDGHFYTIALQYADGVDDETKSAILQVIRRPLKVPEKQNKLAQSGSSDHFGALPRVFDRVGFRSRSFGTSIYEHPLSDRPIETP